jgi:Tub family
VNQPGPSNEPLQCRILRQRVGTLRAADQYILQVCHFGQHLVSLPTAVAWHKTDLCVPTRQCSKLPMFMQLDNGGHFLLAARKRKKSKCSNYLISLEQVARLCGFCESISRICLQFAVAISI